MDEVSEKTMFSVRVQRTTMAALATIARDQERDTSDVAREALDAYATREMRKINARSAGRNVSTRSGCCQDEDAEA